MFGIIYIVLSLLAGKELAEILLFTGKNAQEAGSRNGQHKAFCNQIWVLAAATFGMGTLVFGWTTYMISWAASEETTDLWKYNCSDHNGSCSGFALLETISKNRNCMDRGRQEADQ